MAVASMLILCAFILMNVLAGMGNALEIYTAAYNPYNIEPSECQNTSSKETMTQCAIKSFSNYQPFRYVNGECQMCPGDQLSNLTFDNGSVEFHFPRSHSIISHQVNQTAASAAFIQLSRPPSPGTMIHLAVTPFGIQTSLDLRKPKTRMFHFFIRFDTPKFGSNTYDGSRWGLEEKFFWMLPYFKRGKRTDIHILVTTDRFVIFLDKIFSYEYKYRLPLSEIEQVYVNGNCTVHELTL